MPYNVVFTREAEEDLMRLADEDPVLASAILDHADQLGQDPTTLSRRGGMPYLPGQRYPFWAEGEHGRKFVNLFFEYGQDEQTLWITAISVVG